MDKYLNKIIQGDCLEVMKGMPDKCVDLVLTDPPYSVGMTANGQKANFYDLNLMGPFFKELFSELKRIMKDDAEIYLFTDWRTYPFVYSLFATTFNFRNLIVWDKDKCGPSPYYHFTHEFILYGAKTNVVKRDTFFNYRDLWRIPQFNPMSNERVGHPTQKPISLIKKIVEDSSKESNIVFDPFLGSGTTAAACKELGRDFVGIEINQKYCDIAQKRLDAQSNPMF